MRISNQKYKSPLKENIFSLSIKFSEALSPKGFRVQIQNNLQQRIVIPRHKNENENKQNYKGIIQSLNISRHEIQEEQKTENLQFSKKVKANLRVHGRTKSNQLQQFQQGLFETHRRHIAIQPLQQEDVLSNFSNSLQNISQQIIQIPFVKRKVQTNKGNPTRSKKKSTLEFGIKSNSLKKKPSEKQRNGSADISKYQLKNVNKSKSKSKSKDKKYLIETRLKGSSLIPKSKKSQIVSKIQLSDFSLKALKISKSGAIIYVAVHKKTGLIYAIKSIRKSKIKVQMNEFILELKLGLYFVHPNFARTYGYFHEGDNVYIIRQYLQEGSITQQKNSLSQHAISQSLNQMLSCINTLANIINIKFWHLTPQKLAKSHGIVKVRNIIITLNSLTSDKFSQMTKKMIYFFFQSEDRRSTFEGIQTSDQSIFSKFSPIRKHPFSFLDFVEKILFINESTLHLLWQHDFLKQTRFKSIMQD